MDDKKSTRDISSPGFFFGGLFKLIVTFCRVGPAGLFGWLDLWLAVRGRLRGDGVTLSDLCDRSSLSVSERSDLSDCKKSAKDISESSSSDNLEADSSVIIAAILAFGLRMGLISVGTRGAAPTAVPRVPSSIL